MVGRLLSFSDGIFSGAMLNFQGVSNILSGKLVQKKNCPFFLSKLTFSQPLGIHLEGILLEELQCLPPLKNSTLDEFLPQKRQLAARNDIFINGIPKKHNFWVSSIMVYVSIRKKTTDYMVNNYKGRYFLLSGLHWLPKL